MAAATVRESLIVPPQPLKPITLAWDNPNTPSLVPYLLTEFRSTTNLQVPFSFKAFVQAGLNSVTFANTNAAEFFICRFVQTNVTPWVYSDWNTKL